MQCCFMLQLVQGAQGAADASAGCVTLQAGPSREGEHSLAASHILLCVPYVRVVALSWKLFTCNQQYMFPLRLVITDAVVLS